MTVAKLVEERQQAVELYEKYGLLERRGFLVSILQSVTLKDGILRAEYRTREIGVGMTVAVLVDATIVRPPLLPAAMRPARSRELVAARRLAAPAVNTGRPARNAAPEWTG